MFEYTYCAAKTVLISRNGKLSAIAKKVYLAIERFWSRGQQLCKFVGTRKSFYIIKRFNFYRID